MSDQTQEYVEGAVVVTNSEHVETYAPFSPLESGVEEYYVLPLDLEPTPAELAQLQAEREMFVAFVKQQSQRLGIPVSLDQPLPVEEPQAKENPIVGHPERYVINPITGNYQIRR
jgi:hypothetical protein